MKAPGSILGGMLLLAVGAAHAADLQKGEAAYARGDYAAALAEFEPLAQQRNADAQSDLGTMYANGQGVPLDYVQALAWYREAAAQGEANAQFNLGNMYIKGEGVPMDDAQALAWYRKSAAQGDKDAQAGLGSMYNNGDAVPQDYVQAISWYRKAAAQGDAFAQYNLGVMYATGQGVPKDFVASYALFNLAAASINPNQGAAAEARKNAMALMTPEQIEAGQELTRGMQRLGVINALDVQVKQPAAAEADVTSPAINDAPAAAEKKMSVTSLFALYLIEAYCGVAMMMYRSAASVCNWPVWRWYIGKDDRSFSPMAIFGAAVYIDAVVWDLIKFGWKGALGIAVLAYFVNYPISAVLKWRSQILCPIVGLVCVGIALFGL